MATDDDPADELYECLDYIDRGIWALSHLGINGLTRAEAMVLGAAFKRAKPWARLRQDPFTSQITVIVDDGL